MIQPTLHNSMTVLGIKASTKCDNWTILPSFLQRDRPLFTTILQKKVSMQIFHNVQAFAKYRKKQHKKVKFMSFVVFWCIFRKIFGAFWAFFKFLNLGKGLLMILISLIISLLGKTLVAKYSNSSYSSLLFEGIPTPLIIYNYLYINNLYSL